MGVFMGYGLMVYAVDPAKLIAACGSGDDSLRRGIHEIEGERLAQLDRNFDLAGQKGGPSFSTAVDQLIMGGEKPFPSYLYGYAYEAIVDFLGDFLDNSLFYPVSFQLMAEIDLQLAKCGVPLRIKQLTSGASPAVIPRPDEFPAFGWWPPEEIGISLPRLQAKPAKSDEVNAIQKWLERTAGSKEAIVGFYY